MPNRKEAVLSGWRGSGGCRTIARRDSGNGKRAHRAYIATGAERRYLNGSTESLDSFGESGARRFSRRRSARRRSGRRGRGGRRRCALQAHVSLVLADVRAAEFVDRGGSAILPLPPPPFSCSFPAPTQAKNSAMRSPPLDCSFPVSTQERNSQRRRGQPLARPSGPPRSVTRFRNLRPAAPRRRPGKASARTG